MEATEHMLLDGQLMQGHNLPFSPYNRAFEYGDSLFETIIAKGGKPLHWDFHWERLEAGCKLMGYTQSLASHRWDRDSLLAQVQALLKKQGLFNSWARLKIRVWREEGGKYTPSSNSFHCLVIVSPFVPQKPKELKVGVSEKVRLSFSPWSVYKTGSALQYIIAAQERASKGWDEIILLGQNGEVAECGASNIFWHKEGRWYTPSLSTGCLGGVKRRAIIEYFQKKGENLSTGEFQLSELLDSSHIFTANVAGMQHICHIQDQYFTPWVGLGDLMDELLGL